MDAIASARHALGRGKGIFMMLRSGAFWTRTLGQSPAIGTSPHPAEIRSRWPAVIPWISHHRLGLLLGLLIAGAAALAQQATDPGIEGDAPSADVEQGDVDVAGSFATVPNQTPVSLTSDLPAHDPTVGRLAGNASVSGGAATYSIPIALPPGRRGMQPDLALNYSSRAGNGIAGMGWSLSGLSSVSRCPSTLDQDGVIRAVELDAGDKLCLDGQRLLATSGPYGQPGTTYATEVESFSRVTQLGGALNAATAYFKVETKSGDVVYYGGTSTATNAARVIPGSVTLPMSWLIERRHDRVGNFVRYAYASYGNGETLLAKVHYTGFGTSDGDRSVEMAYETRPTTSGSNDQSSSYLAGGLSRQSQRLRAITTRVGTQPVRSYQLAYSLSGATGRSLLSSVTDCAFAGTDPVCRPATRFTWQSQPLLYRFGKLQLSAAAGVPNLNWEFATSAGGGDFNGDGARDVFGLAPDPANPGSKVGYLLTLSPERKVTAALKIDPNSPLRSYGPNADFDLDGRTDVVSYDANKNITIWFWHGPANATSTSQALTRSWNTGIGDPRGFVLQNVEDMNGDGRPDLITQREAPTPSDSCRRVVETYLNRASAAGPGAQATFEKASSFCLRSRSDVYGRQYMWEKIRSISDLNGDSLPEIFINETGHSDDMQYRRFYWGCNGTSLCGSGYGLIETYFNSALPANDPRTNYQAMLAAAGVPPDDDINGDGLKDWFVANCGLRLNTGKGFAPCGPVTNSGNVEPPLARDIGSGRRSTIDLDGDGRQEHLEARAYVARYCQKFIPDCPGGDDRPECRVRYLCPEDAVSGTLPFNRALFNGEDWPVSGLYNSHYGHLDSSPYRMGARRYVEIGPGQFRVEWLATSIVHGLGGSFGEDLFGDGLADGVTRVDCYFSDADQCVIPSEATSPEGAVLGDFPTVLPDGSAALSRGLYINENRGPGGVMSPDGLTPQTPDLMAAVTDGWGVKTIWTYYPLSSKAGRAVGETPLYAIPADAASRYLDDRHFYFTSSMPVVSDMVQSDGIGDYRSWRYGYAEAMYHARGRGFQGFRTIIEEDEAAGIRTTTTFHQKFPLTSQPQQVVLNSLKRKGLDGAISKQVFTWRCNRADRDDAMACTPPSGMATVKFPFLDTQETWTYDAAIADNPAGGSPPQIAYRIQVAADDSTCAGSFAASSGYDAYGNLRANTVLSYDSGMGTGGYRPFAARHCARTRSSYQPADIANWWLDRLSSRNVTTTILHDSTHHPLPAGVNNPAHSVTTHYVWNANRTPASETLQPGIANEQRVTSYAYPTTDYGLPSSLTVTASGDPNGARRVSTTYSADGYFPQTVTNPLGHATTTLTRREDGQPSQITDANGLRTIAHYDAFGFNTLTRYRGTSDAAYVAPDQQKSLSWCVTSACRSTFTEVMTRMAVVQDGAPTQYAFADRFGRQVVRLERLADTTWGRSATEYDAVGRVSAEAEPHRWGEVIHWTRFPTYDVLGRPLRKLAPQANHDGRGDRVTTYTYSGRQTRIRVCGSADPDSTRCLNMSRTTDSLGRYAETVDAKSGITKFWYDGSGNALAIRDAKGGVISADYNALGQRTAVSDPNQGDWHFAYNGLGELLRQTDARGIVTTTAYDDLGRPLQRAASYDYDGVAPTDSVVDRWTYDPAYGKGSEASNERLINGISLRRAVTTFDPLSRPVTQAITQRRAIGGAAVSLTQQTAYDTYYGWPKAQGYGNAETLWLRYSRYGHLIRETDAVSGADYRVVNTIDARGNSTQETWAGGYLKATRSYAPQTGQALSMLYSSPATSQLRRVRRRKPKKVPAGERQPLLRPIAANQVWSMDFVFDRTAEGRVIKCLTIVDDATHEAVAIETERAICDHMLTRVLDRLALSHGLPKVIRTDNGKEFCGKAIVTWAHHRGVDLRLIEPGKPNQNAYVESFNGRFRDECKTLWLR